jgi:hypothetical protein
MVGDGGGKMDTSLLAFARSTPTPPNTNNNTIHTYLRLNIRFSPQLF